ncbi:MAG: DUF6057 family protein [Bacteroidia bacterium]|nr:DUF6057 family protein [Bacteroidia bacterium]
MKTGGKISIGEIIIISLFPLACLVFFGVFYRYHIFFEEQLQIFLLTGDHFLSYLSKPAFLSSYAGDFLTQFYYLKWGGAVVITITMLVLWFTVRLVIKKVSDKDYPVLLPIAPVILCWIALCRIDYPVSNVISLIISVLFTLIIFSIKSHRARFLWSVLLTPLLYLIAGSNVFIFCLSVVFYELFKSNSSSGYPMKILNSLILLGVAVFIPLNIKDEYLLTTGQALTYLSGMTMHPGIINFLPVISVLLIFFLACISFEKVKEKINSLLSVLIQFIILAAILVSGILMTADFTLEKILKLDYIADHGQWNKVRELASQYKIHNDLSAYYTNLALSKLGLMPDELMEHYQPLARGLFIPVDMNQNYITITFSNEVYWQLGDVNASQHSAMLGMIFSPRAQNSRLLKRLVEINIVNGEYAAAEKFIRILEKTLFHRKWAETRRKFLYNEKECSGSEWIREKRAIIPSKDLLKDRNEYLKTLKMLADDHPDNRMAVDYLLCYDLLCKDIRTFVKDFDKYYTHGRNILLPKVYQEGLLIGIASGEYSHEEYSKFRFSPEIVKNMAEYTKLFEENKGKGYALQEKFSKTYWFYYHFATMKTDEK